jgi:hypothetical protein
MSQISNQRLREIIIEEAKKILSEDAVDHVAVKDVVNKAADLITAIADFKEDASPGMMNALTPHLDSVEKALQNMVSTPGSYVSAPKKEPKVVSLRSTPTTDK